MHLTNFSLNKENPDFLWTEELFEANDGSKQTLTSLWAGLEEDNVDTSVIIRNIDLMVAKTLLAMEGCMDNMNMRCQEELQSKGNKFFQILGIDILIDENLDAWFLEVNSRPSLVIQDEIEVSEGVFETHLNVLDSHIKT